MARAWLKQLRVERSLTQAGLASAAGIKTARYSRIEAGYCEPRDEEAKALADALKQPVEFIKSGNRRVEPKGPSADTTKARQETAAATTRSVSTPSPLVVAPKGLSAANANQPPQTGPKGDDLSDPKNFTLLPPTEALTGGALAPTEFRNRLQQHIAFAVKVLHTSKVQPRIWVAWRDFHKEAQNRLHGPEPTPKTSVVNEPAPPPKKEVSVTLDKPVVSANPPRQRAKGNKNLFGFFVEVAKELLPAEKIASLCALAATAKNQRPELGFMKHFKLIAEAELSPSDFRRIVAEAEKRLSS